MPAELRVIVLKSDREVNATNADHSIDCPANRNNSRAEY